MQSKKGKDINKAFLLLQDGNIVAIPTETVYGLACNALNEKAVESLYIIKERSFIKALPIQVSSVEEVIKYVKFIPEPINRLMNLFCPGPLTIILEKTDLIPDILTAGLRNVAIRIPDHPVTLELLKKCPFPLAVTSANISGHQNLTNADSVLSELNGKIPYVLDGGSCKIAKESTIVGFERDKMILYRVGAISLDNLLEILPEFEFEIRFSA
jgi:L-threonylcarbamoyladenylate synthase